MQFGCDGVHVRAGDVAAARRIVGTGVSVGAACGWSRDAAMSAAEAGADYVAFGPATEAGEAGRQAIADWSLAMVVPCVVAGGIDASSAPGWAAAGADFLAVGRAVWQAPAGPEAALRDLARGLRGG
jgi:thiamine-phosphate pyrophosphorylase